MLDAEALAEVTAEIVREHVAKSLAPVLEENARLRERVAVIEAREPPAPDVSVIKALVDAAVAELPPAAPGKDGEDYVPDMAEVARVIDESVQHHMAAIQPPRDGASVTLDDVQPLIDRAVSDAVANLPVAKDGIGLAGAFIDRAGELVVTLTNGATHALGPVVGRDYDEAVLARAVEDAVARIPIPKDGDAGKDADPAVIKQMVEDAVALIPVPEDGKDAYPGEARGLFDPEAAYRAMDVVSFNGCEWRAKCDAPGCLPGDGWMLSAQRGKPGKPGDPGKPGKPGLAGASMVGLRFDSGAMRAEAVLDNGEIISTDIYDFAEAIRAA